MATQDMLAEQHKIEPSSDQPLVFDSEMDVDVSSDLDSPLPATSSSGCSEWEKSSQSSDVDMDTDSSQACNATRSSLGTSFICSIQICINMTNLNARTTPFSSVYPPVSTNPLGPMG